MSELSQFTTMSNTSTNRLCHNFCLPTAVNWPTTAWQWINNKQTSN